MQLIRCTAKLRKEMGLKDHELFQDDIPTSGLGAWHANLLYINRRKCVLFTNDKTLLNFIAPDVNREEIRSLDRLFIGYLRPILAEEGISAEACEEIAREYSELRYAKTTDKSILGSMNDLAFHYKHRIMDAGGLHKPEIPEIIHSLNNMPMGALEYVFPSEALRQHLRTEA